MLAEAMTILWPFGLLPIVVFVAIGVDMYIWRHLWKDEDA